MPDGDHSSIDVVRDAARAAGGPAFVFYAPFTVPDAATAAALRRQPDVARAFAQLPRVTKAVAGVGLWAPGQSTLFDTAPEADREELRRLGVCAEVSGVFLSADGAALQTPLSDRMIGIDARQMAAIPEVVVIAWGSEKARAVRAALHSGLVGGLVTHTALAEALLDEP
jgi:DNA-binding transcriptional regulator LsrR (DeoR family)